MYDEFGYVNIIYLRVSTTNLGQQEEDQLKNIIDTFRLDAKKCFIIQAKESAYQMTKQNNRKFSIILDVLQELDIHIEKHCYFWSIDRIYRNRELLEEFYQIAKKHNTKIYSHIEQFINVIADLQDKLPDEMRFILDIQIKQLVSFFGWMAEMESKKKSERMYKSFTIRKGRYFTNKGTMIGGKLKYISGKKLKEPEKIMMLEKFVIQKLKKGVRYRDVQKLILEQAKLQVSLGWITAIGRKYGLVLKRGNRGNQTTAVYIQHEVDIDNYKTPRHRKFEESQRIYDPTK